MGLRTAFAALLPHVRQAALENYGDNLVSLAVFGSVARGTPGPDSDVDLLVVCRRLPRGRAARMLQFAPIEDSLSIHLRQMWKEDIHTTLSPVLKTATEAQMGSHLFLDMIHDVILLHDSGNFLADLLATLRTTLHQSGARRIQQGSRWYWELNPTEHVKGGDDSWQPAP